MPNILSGQFPYYGQGATATLLLYARDSFVAQGGTPVVKGKYPSETWRHIFNCTVSSGTLTVPSQSVEATTDSDNPTAEWEAVLIDEFGERQNFIVKRFKLSHQSAETTWQAIRQFNELPLVVEEFGLTTDNVPEGSNNLYFTNERVGLAVTEELADFTDNFDDQFTALETEINSVAANFANYQLLSLKGQPNGYAPLNGSSKIPSEFLPPITVNNITAVANQAARLALSAVVGDAAKQLDTGETYLLSTLPASVNANWIVISDISPDWTVITGKPIFGTASLMDVPTSGNAASNQVVKGDDSRFLPVGGSANQILAKINNVNFNTEWIDAPVGGGSGGTIPFENDAGNSENIELTPENAIPFEDDAGLDDDILLAGLSVGGGAVESVNGQDGAVVLDTDDIAEGAINKYNQTHTGDVTGATVLTIANNAVITSKVADSNITSAKIADSNITTAKIADGNVTDIKVASGINAAKIGAGIVDNTEFGHLNGVTGAIQSQLDTKAPLVSPALTGNPTTPNQTAGDNSTKIANTAFVTNAIANLISSAPGLLDTLDEIAAALGDDPNFAATMTTALSGKMVKSANLSDLSNAVTARSNLGLGAIALLASIATANIDNDAVTYQKIQNVSATDRLLGRSSAGAGDIEEIPLTAAGRALIDDTDASAQRATLGLGGLAILNAVGTSQITDANVTTAKIANANVTADKIATGAVTPVKRAAIVVLTDAGTVAIDASLSEKFKLTSSSSRTIGIPSSPLDGQTIIITFKNSAGTSQTLSLTTGSAGSFKFTDAVPNLTATPAGKTDLITAYYDADLQRWLVVGYAKES